MKKRQILKTNLSFGSRLKQTLSLFGLLLAFLLAAGGMSAQALAAETTVIASGECGAEGNNVIWELDDEGTLTISGNGEMQNSEQSEYPWYEYQENIVSLIIESGVTTISDEAFDNYYNLTSVQINSGLISIGDKAFFICGSLSTVSIPDSVTTLGSNVFAFCSSLEQITIPSSVTSIGEGAFAYCSNLAGVVLPSNIAVIEAEMFKECTNLSEITIPDKVEIISSEAFYLCTNLTEIMIPSGVTTIGERAFVGCIGLTEIAIPSSVNKIGSNAFCQCENFTSVTIPSSVSSIGEGAFAGCDSLTEIVLEDGNKNYLVEDGVLFDKNKTIILCYPSGKTEESYKIPFGVKTIPDGAFCVNGNSALKFLTIPSSVTKIETWAFDNFLNFNENISIKFEGDMPEFEIDSFLRAIVQIYYPDTWENLPTNSFLGADSIKWIPYKVKLDTPQLISVSNASKGVTVKWAKVTGAAKYRVFRKSGSGSWIKVADTTSTSCTDTKAKSGTTYTYTVRCISSDGKTYTSDYDKTGKIIKYIAQPVLSSVANASNGITIKWAKVTGAAKYRVFRKSGSGSWAKVRDTTSTSYTDTTVKSGTTYTYTVRCISSNGKTYTSSYDKTGKSIKRLAQPAAAVKNSSKGITVSWKKITGASGYYVYRKASGESSYKMVKKITSGSALSYTNTGLTNGKNYSYKVKAYSGSYVSAGSSAKSYYRLTSPSVSSLKNSASKKMTVKWAQNSKATGYQVQYSTSSKFSSAVTKTISGYKNVTKTITGLTKGKTYYVRVRSYKTVSGVKYYSGWSTVKSVKISK